MHPVATLTMPRTRYAGTESPARARILLVGSEPFATNRLRAPLLQRRFGVSVTCDCPSAWTLATGSDFYDLIVLDLTDQRWDGLALCRAIRAPRPALPIIALLPPGSVEQLLASFAAGANACLLGGFSLEALLAQIHALLRTRHSGRRAGAGARRRAVPDCLPRHAAV